MVAIKLKASAGLLSSASNIKFFLAEISLIRKVYPQITVAGICKANPANTNDEHHNISNNPFVFTATGRILTKTTVYAAIRI